MRSWDDIYRECGVVQNSPMDFVVKHVPTLRERGVGRVLDLGCGTGRHVVFLLDEGFDVCGLDASKKAISLLSEVLRKRGAKGVDLKVADMAEVPWLGGFFDAVVCTQAIQHMMFGSIRKAASEICRVLRPGGVLVLTTLSVRDGAYGRGEKVGENTFIPGVPPDGDVVHHFFTMQELSSLFSGFEFVVLEEVEKKPELRPVELGVFWELVAVKKQR